MCELRPPCDSLLTGSPACRIFGYSVLQIRLQESLNDASDNSLFFIIGNQIVWCFPKYNVYITSRNLAHQLPEPCRPHSTSCSYTLKLVSSVVLNLVSKYRHLHRNYPFGRYSGFSRPAQAMSVMGEKANGTIPNAPSNTSAASLSSHYTEKSNQKLETRDICGSVGDMERLDVTKTNSHHQPEPDVEKPASDGPAFAADAEENYKPKTVKFWLVILCTMGSMFLVALDRTILSTAVPRITDDFKSLGDIGWYGSAYMLTTAAFQLVFGRVYRFYDLRWTYLGCILIFEVGSTLCGAAPTSNVFIVGRAIAGVGSAGILTGSMMTIIPMVPLHKRPMFQCKPTFGNL